MRLTVGLKGPPLAMGEGGKGRLWEGGAKGGMPRHQAVPACRRGAGGKENEETAGYAQLHWSTLLASDQPWPWGCGFCSAICRPSRA